MPDTVVEIAKITSVHSVTNIAEGTEDSRLVLRPAEHCVLVVAA